MSGNSSPKALSTTPDGRSGNEHVASASPPVSVTERPSLEVAFDAVPHTDQTHRFEQ